MNAISIFDNKIKGTVKFHQPDIYSLCKVVIDLHNFKQDKVRGIHIHTYGDTREGCDSACTHFNPYNILHGNRVLHVSVDGNAYTEYYDDLINLFAPIQENIIGRMVVVHEDKDNLGFDRDTSPESATTGKAGKRLDCAPIVLCKPFSN